MLYVYAGLSLRQCAKSLGVFNFMLCNKLGRTPCYTTIGYWVEKAGLAEYNSKSDVNLKDAYATIVDGSISVGDQQMMLLLAVPVAPAGESLKREDQKVIGMKVATSWKAKDVQEFIEKTEKEVGKESAFTISDEGTNLRKALEDMNKPHHIDISHRFSTILKSVYSQDFEYKAFDKAVGETRRYALTDVAYLMPAKQRAIARFMNKFIIIDWAKRMLDNFYKLSKKEKFFYSFLLRHACIIEELAEVMEVYTYCLRLCKTQGLSYGTAEECISLAREKLLAGSERQRKILCGITEYFNKEKRLLVDSNDVHVITSDLIESDFGLAKQRLSNNRNNGFTAMILMLPLYPRLCRLEKSADYDVKTIFESKRMSDLKSFRLESLRPNPNSKRIYKLAANS